MIIRPFEEKDRDGVVSLWEACDLVVPWNDPSRDIDLKLAVDPDMLLVGIIDGEVVASVMGGYEGHRGWINYLAVLPAMRGRGLGRKMMEAVEERIRSRGCPKICLQVRKTNPGAVGFYKHMGYSEDEVVGLGKMLDR